MKKMNATPKGDTNNIKIYSFDGGIHPQENKEQSTRQPIRTLPMPQQLVLPLAQHIGANATPVVNVGDTVLKGQKIAEAQGFVSAPLHAPTSGTVTHIEERIAPHSSGLTELSIVIAPDGKETWVKKQSLHTELQLNSNAPLPAEAVLERIRESGIAGLGGAGFPSSVKLAVREYQIDTLILNGAECEPYITADDMLMRERADKVIRGAEILFDLIQPERCLIGVEDNKPEAIKALIEASQHLHSVQVVTIPTKYPSGGEKQLIQILTGKEVPSASIPANLGIVCQNVGTAAAIAEAIDEGKPLISRITTLTGDAIQNKGNYEVLLGTPVEDVLRATGYQCQNKERLIMGGPMMGFQLPSTQVPVVKTTNCLLAPTEQELPPNDTPMACIRCGICADACPADLLPQQLYWFSKAQEFDKAEQHNLFDCIECGACSYVCPSQIPLVQYYRYAKGSIKEERAAHEKSEQARERFESRLARQEREQAEKDAKRKARAEAAAKAKAEKAKLESQQSESGSKAETTSQKADVSTKPTDELEKKILAQKNRVEKSQERLNAAQEQGLDTVEALKMAVNKQQDKLAGLEQELAKTKELNKAQEATE